MTRDSQEYSLADLVEHPVIRLVLQRDGLDGRSLDSLLSEGAREHRDAQGWREEPVNT